MGTIVYEKQPDGTVTKSETLDDPKIAVEELKEERNAIQARFDVLQDLVNKQLPLIAQQLVELDKQIAELTLLATVAVVDPLDPIVI